MISLFISTVFLSTCKTLNKHHKLTYKENNRQRSCVDGSSVFRQAGN